MKKLMLMLLRIQFKILSIVSPQLAVNRASLLFFTPRRHPAKPIEIQIKQQASKHKLASGVVYYSWGVGKPVVFIHGWEGRATQVSSLLEKLGTKYRVIAIDAPAHGDSEGNLSHPKYFVDALFEVISTVGPVHAIIGHSMGGGSATYAASKGIECDNIVSIAGPSNFLHVVNDFARFIGLSGSARKQFLSHVESTVGIPYTQLDPSLFPANPKPGFLAIHDEYDVEVPVSHAKMFKQDADDVLIKITRGLGHRKILFAEETSDTIMAFLDRPVPSKHIIAS